jgi:DmsE family decaheme c-type cytochrome
MRFSLLVALSFLPVAATAGSSVQSPLESILAYRTPQSEESSSTEDCRGCHEESLARFNRTHHAAQADSCYACHQGVAAEEHLRGQLEGEDAPGPSFEALSVNEASAVCLSCHESTHVPTWEGNAHSRRDVSCIDCHAVHSFESERNQLQTRDASVSCNACHQNIRAQMLRTSHHPVREGLMGCESCHDPHDGSTPQMIKADWVNELCLQCHQEKRGPFLWEHAPVREDCLQCHNPHGSNHDKLLVAKQPYLCQRCHLNTRHPGTLYDGLNAGNPIASASNRAVEHACKNCHQSVHGGNAPSGPYLGR